MEDVSSGVEFEDWCSAREKLRTLREEGGRKSWEVVALGERLLREYPGKLGNEGIFLCQEAVLTRNFSLCVNLVWDIREQVVIAALDVANLSLAEVIVFQARKLKC